MRTPHRQPWLLLVSCLISSAAFAQAGAGDPPIDDFMLPPDLTEPAPLPPPTQSTLFAPVASEPAPTTPAVEPAPVTPAAEPAPTTTEPATSASTEPAPTEPTAEVAEPVAAAEPTAPEAPPAPFEERHLRLAPASSGETGLRRTLSATPGTVGHVRLNVAADYSGGSNFLVPGDTQTRTTGTFAASYVPDPTPFLELFALYRNASNHNAKNDPSTILTLGDMQIGAKAGWTLKALRESLSLGVDLSLNPMSGIGDVTFDGGATSVEARALATWDARRLWNSVPLRVHLNAGYASPAALASENDVRTTCVEEFATGASRFHRGLVGLGLEAPLAKVTPFVEAALELPAGVSLTDTDGCAFSGNTPPEVGRTVAYGDIVPLSFVLGARITALPSNTFDVGAELGATRYHFWGVRTPSPWSAFLAVSYAFDPIPEPEIREVVREVPHETVRFEEKLVEKVVEVAPAPTKGRVTGLVKDAQSGLPLGDAILSVLNEAALPVATAPSGRYETVELPPGKYRLVARRAAYDTASAEVEIKAGEFLPVDFALQKRAEPAVLLVKVRGPNGKGVAGAKVVLVGAKVLEATSDREGTAKFEKLAAGNVRVVVDGATFLARGAATQLASARTTELEVVLAAKPKKPAVKASPEGISLTKRLVFTDKHELAPADLEVADQLADLVLRAPAGTRLHFEVHADAGPAEELNLANSQARADALRARLVTLGVASEAIESIGVGSANPVVPRLGKKAREKNERVELKFVGP